MLDRFPTHFGGFELTSNESGSFLFFMKPSHSVIKRKEIKGYSTSTSLFTGCIQVMVIGLLYFVEKQKVAIMMMMMMMMMMIMMMFFYYCEYLYIEYDDDCR